MLSFGCDRETVTLRPRVVVGELEARVRDELTKHPEASANDVLGALGANRKRVLELVKSAEGR